jgi:arylsulfatase A-like enzyme
VDGATTRAAPRLSVRALLAWPLATSGLAAMQAFVAHDRQGGAIASIVWAIATGFAIGAWAGLLHALVSAVVGRVPAWSRASLRMRASVPGPSVRAAAAVGALAVLLGSWWAIDRVYALVRGYPLDYDAVGRAIWRGAAALVLPAIAAILWLGLRTLEIHLRDRPRVASIVARVSATLLVALPALHLSRGPIFVYFGPLAMLAIVLAAAAVAASWLPRADVLGRRKAGIFAGTWLVLAIVGGLGLRDPGVRSLLLHEGPLFAEVHRFFLGFADGDGDGDHPPWLGGTDCDDADPAVSGAAKEVAANGIDDNCRAGDAPAFEPVRAVPGPPPARPPIVLVTIDTLRADRLELYGAARDTMPALARLGSEGVVFERAYAPANHTFFSVTALLSGLSTERMIVPGPSEVPQLSYARWLPHVMGSLGYHRVAVDPPLLLDGKMQPADLHFDTIDIGPFDNAGQNRGVKARQVADAAIAWLRAWRGDDAVLLWVHFMDPHAVHVSPERFAVHGEADAYDNELSWVDFHLARLLEEVDDTFHGQAHVIVTSDHGEQLGEAGGWGHGFSLRDVEIRVPLVVRAPDLKPARIAEPVSLLRVPGTVLHWLGYAPDVWPDAPSLLAAPEIASPPVVATNPAFLWNERRMEAALVEAPWKLVHARTTNTTLLFDTDADPAEQSDLAAREPEIRDRMLARLLDHLERGG